MLHIGRVNMKIQLGNSSYIQSVKKDSSNRLFDALFLDKHKKSKATYEIKNRTAIYVIM